MPSTASKLKEGDMFLLHEKRADKFSSVLFLLPLSIFPFPVNVTLPKLAVTLRPQQLTN
jgi:hypothetical protein